MRRWPITSPPRSPPPASREPSIGATHTGATLGLLLAARGVPALTALILEGPLLPGRNPPVVVDAAARAAAIARRDGVAAARAAWWRESPWFEAMRAEPDRRRAAAHRAIVEAFSGRPWLDDAPAATVPDTTAALSERALPAFVYTGAEDHAEFQDAADRIAALLPAAQR